MVAIFEHALDSTSSHKEQQHITFKVFTFKILTLKRKTIVLTALINLRYVTAKCASAIFLLR